MIFTGSAVALVTPFNEDNTPNFEKIKELVEYHIANGTDAIVATGTTGEASTMTDEEQLDVIKCIVDTVNKRIPVIAGASTNDTRHSLSLAKGAQDMGADALLIITPYYNKANRTGLKAHFKTIADAVDLPIILYNVPSRTGVNIAPDLVAELANECENIVAIKEASGDIAQVAEVARLVPDDFAIYSGNDDSITPLLSLGGSGVISVLANVCPQQTHDLVAKFLDGDVKGSCKIQLELKALIDALFIEVNPVPVKTALNLLGFEIGHLRLPLGEMNPKNLEVLKQELINAGLDVKQVAELEVK